MLVFLLLRLVPAFAKKGDDKGYIVEHEQEIAEEKSPQSQKVENL